MRMEIQKNSENIKRMELERELQRQEQERQIKLKQEVLPQTVSKAQQVIPAGEQLTEAEAHMIQQKQRI